MRPVSCELLSNEIVLFTVNVPCAIGRKQMCPGSPRLARLGRDYVWANDQDRPQNIPLMPTFCMVQGCPRVVEMSVRCTLAMGKECLHRRSCAHWRLHLVRCRASPVDCQSRKPRLRLADPARRRIHRPNTSSCRRCARPCGPRWRIWLLFSAPKQRGSPRPRPNRLVSGSKAPPVRRMIQIRDAGQTSNCIGTAVHGTEQTGTGFLTDFVALDMKTT